MKEERNLYDITEEIQFYQLKEMLFCMKGLSYSNDELVGVMKRNGGLLKYFDKIKEEYKVFQTKERIRCKKQEKE